MIDTRNSTVAAIIPAHHEEDQICDAVLALLRQTRPLDLVLVVADNCTDGTVDVVRQLQSGHPSLELLETTGNTARKAGALNQGLRHLDGRFAPGPDFVLQQDADSVLHHRFVAAALDEMARDHRIGGCSGRYQVKEYLRLSPVAWFLCQLQRMDNLRYDSMRMEAPDNPAVLSGTGSLFRHDALRAVGGWDESSLVEDFSMTLDLKGGGWKAAVARRAYTRTDVPLTVGELWRQRMRFGTRFPGPGRMGTTLAVAGALPAAGLVASWVVVLIASGGHRPDHGAMGTAADQRAPGGNSENRPLTSATRESGVDGEGIPPGARHREETQPWAIP